jgi:hypothetical protein
MRLKIGTALLATVIALTAWACTGETSQLRPIFNDGDPTTIDRPPHWLNRAGPGGEAVVLFTIDPSVPTGLVRTSDGKSLDVRAQIRRSAADWSQAANFKFQDATPNEGQYTCTSSSNCILIKAADRDGGSNGWNPDVVHVRQGPYGMTVTLSNRWSQMTLAFIVNMICHEEGHTAGPLMHPKTGTGPCQNGKPTSWDLGLVAQNNEYHAH